MVYDKRNGWSVPQPVTDGGYESHRDFTEEERAVNRVLNDLQDQGADLAAITVVEGTLFFKGAPITTGETDTEL